MNTFRNALVAVALTALTGTAFAATPTAQAAAPTAKTATAAAPAKTPAKAVHHKKHSAPAAASTAAPTKK